MVVMRSSQRVDRRLFADWYAHRVRQSGFVKRVRAIRVALGLVVLLSAGVAVSVFGAVGSVGTARAVSTTVTATAVRIGDHPAYVRAVIDFTGSTVGANPEVFATDTQPLDGGASLQYVIAPGVRTTARPQTRFGLTASVVKNARGLRIDLRAVRLRFKYLSYAWVPGRRLAIDLWKSAPPSRAAEIHRGQGGCLTLDSVSLPRADGVVEAAGRERGVFEHQFRVVVRAADGGVLVQRTVHARSGRWKAELLASSQRLQAGTLEAVALSPADGALVCLVQQRITLPYTGPAPLQLRYRAHADVDGDGRPDLITLRKASQHQGGLIRVALASGRRISVKTSMFAVFLPALVAVGDVDGRGGDELFVDVEHISTNEFIGIYTYWKGQLRLAATMPGYSAHPGLWAGMTCSARGVRHFVTVHQFVLTPSSQPHYWTQQDPEYVWQGPALKLYTTGPTRRLTGLPPPGLVGLHCGHPPTP